MKILVVNAGSSSLKYQLFDMESGAVLAKGNCERIGIDGVITHKRPGKDDYKSEANLPDHKAAIELVLSLLCDAELGVISGVDERNFGVGLPVTRQDMAVIVSRCMEFIKKIPAEVKEDEGFADEESISEYAKLSVKEL